MNRDQAPDLPLITPRSARRLLVGLWLLQGGIGLLAWSTGTGRPVLSAWVALLAGFALALGSGAFRLAPTTPGQLSRLAQAARWPGVLVVPVGMLALAVNIVGVLYGFYAAFLQG